MNEKFPQTISLDCVPGSVRPNDLIESVLEGTGLIAGEPVSKSFGHWVWEFTMSDEEWKEIQEVTRPRIIDLYKSGQIRYGSW